MSPSATPAKWQRLGELLVRRRVELDPRYQNRTVFTAERGLDYRLAFDIEEAKRTNFRKGTLAGIAVAYGVTLDSLYAALDGGQLEPTMLQAPTPQLRVVQPGPAEREGHDDAGTDPAESLLYALVAEYGSADDPDSSVVRALAAQYGHGKPAEVIVREIREWLRVTGATGRNGAAGALGTRISP